MAVVPLPPTIEVGQSDTTELNLFRDSTMFLLDKPAFMLNATANQSLTNAVYTALSLGAESLDDDPVGSSGHDNVTNNSRWSATYAGWYAISGIATYASNATGSRQAALFVNGTVVTGALAALNAATTGQTAMSTGMIMVYLAVGDYVEVYGFQNSGGALNTGHSGGYIPSLAGSWERLT